MAEKKGQTEQQAERPQTYALQPRDLADVAREAEEGKRDAAPAGTAGWAPKREELHWGHGYTHIKNAHGHELTERARELVRRALGELYQEAQGAEPASALAHEVADSVGDTKKLNDLGNEQHDVEFRGANQRGQAYYG